MTACSLTHTEHDHAGRNCRRRHRAAARDGDHGAAWICSHGCNAESGTPCSYWDPCPSDTCLRCKREDLACCFLCSLSKVTIHRALIWFDGVCVPFLQNNLKCLKHMCACRKRWRMWKSVETFCRRWSSWHPVENSPLRPQPMSKSWSRTCWYLFPLSFSVFIFLPFL